MIRIISTCVFALMLCFAASGCKTNPATGRSNLNMISQSQELALGEEASPQFLEEYGGPIPSPAVRQYVRDLGMRLAKISERPNLPWEFFAVDSAVINAFALPGGKVFVSRALLERMTNEAQLAGVLGHEIGHVTAEHIGQRMTQAMILQGAVAAVGVASSQSDEQWLQVLGIGTSVAGQGYLLSFSRDNELEADKLGVRYMAKLNYDPYAQVQVMKILKQASGGGGSRLMEILSTHPMPDTRIEALEKRIRNTYPRAGKKDSRFGYFPERYQSTVLANLKKLPPPKHQPTEQ